jgi:hypothetical protein
MKGRGVKFGWSEMTFRAIRCSHALARDSHEVGIQLTVGILIVEHRYGISARCHSGKFADCLFIRYRRFNPRNGFLAVLRKAIGRRIERAKDLALVITQSPQFRRELCLLERLGPAAKLP